MTTIGDALRDTISDNYGVDGGGGTKPAQIIHIVDNKSTPPYRPTTEYISIQLPIPCRRDAENDKYANVTCHLIVRISTTASDDRLKVIVDEVRKICGLHAISGVHAQSVIAEDDVSNRRVPIYIMELTVELTSNMVSAGVAYEGITYEGHTHSHSILTNVTANQHHPQSHTLASHSTKAHSELTGVTADQHHAEAHTHDGDTLQLDGVNSNGGAFAFNTTGGVTFNQWIGTTGSQMAIKKSGGASDVAELLMGGNRVAVGYDGAGSLFLTGKTGKQVKLYTDNTLAFRVDILQDAFFTSDVTATGNVTAANIITSGLVDSVDVSDFKSSYDTHVADGDAHHAMNHILSGTTHTASGLTIGDVLSADSATTFSWKAPASDITGSGTQWKLPVWDTTSSLSDSMLSQDSGGTLLTVGGDMTVNETIRRTASNQALVLLGGNAEATGASLVVTGDTYASPASVIISLSAGASGGQFRIMDYDGVSTYTEAFTINSDGYIDHYGKSNSFSDNDAIAWDSGSSKFTVQTLSGTDDLAIHDNVANEITAITPKTALASADEFILEDSGASFVKKAVTFSYLQSSMSLANLGTRTHASLSDAPSTAHQALASVTALPLTISGQAITFNYNTNHFKLTGNNLEMGTDTPGNTEVLTWNGSSAVWSTAGAGGPGSGTPWDIPVWDATGNELTDSMLSQDSGGTTLTVSGDIVLTDSEIRRNVGSSALVLMGGDTTATGAQIAIGGKTYASPGDIVFSLRAGAAASEFRIFDYDGVSTYTEIFELTHTGNLQFDGSLTVGSIAAGTSDYNKFIVSDGGIMKFRTGTEMLSDIGAASTGEAHVLATTGPHTGTLPWTDLSKTGSSIADLATRTHASLSDAPADAHHVAFVLSDFTTAFASESLANLTTRNHASLSDAPTSAHHVRYANSEAVAAVVAQNPLTLTYDLVVTGGDATLNNTYITATLANIKQAQNWPIEVTAASYSNSDYHPLIAGFTTSSNPTKPKVGIFARYNSLGSQLFFSTSNAYATGLVHHGYIDETGNWYFQGNLTLAGGNIISSLGNNAITIDSSGDITKVGQDTPSTNQYLQWDGSKVIWTSIGAGGPGAGTAWDLPVWDATGNALTDSMVSQNSAGTALTIGAGTVAMSGGLSGVTTLSMSGALTGATSIANSTTITSQGAIYNDADSSGVYTGEDNDLRMYHSGTNGYLKCGTGVLYLEGATSTLLGGTTQTLDTYIRAPSDEAIRLQLATATKMSISSSGIQLFATLFTNVLSPVNNNVDTVGTSTTDKYLRMYASTFDTGDIAFANGFNLREVRHPDWDGDKDALDKDMWAWSKDDGVTPGLEFYNNRDELIALLDEDGDFHIRGKLHECSDIFN